MAKVLLVDDDDDVRYALGKYLRRAGHEIVEAANGKAALILLATDRFDTVVTDIIMPDADGIELTIAVAREYPALPVIAISGGGRGNRMDYLRMAKGLGAKATLPKPVDPDELLALIDQVASPGRSAK